VTWASCDQAAHLGALRQEQAELRARLERCPHELRRDLAARLGAIARELRAAEAGQ
jgi:hypothetical protein